MWKESHMAPKLQIRVASSFHLQEAKFGCSPVLDLVRNTRFDVRKQHRAEISIPLIGYVLPRCVGFPSTLVVLFLTLIPSLLFSGASRSCSGFVWIAAISPEHHQIAQDFPSGKDTHIRIGARPRRFFTLGSSDGKYLA
ncbi:uncharacterized protein LOC118647707 [Monomorium pharaonis]|uniref:uncharacterized protein LOC118647707 n=1 Tax=Monomorium pharaonis TaxID=307658 RepID=UPI0017471C85|nr:uncharacterized protein LOC118647707 [Monomorium pharaonis]